MLSKLSNFYTQNIQRRLTRHLNNLQIWKMARRVAKSVPAAEGAPVIFFKASSGVDDLSWNAAFHLLTSWAFRLQGIPVRFFACKNGMTHCVLGTNRDNVKQKPPCASCTYQSKTLYTGADAQTFSFNADEELDRSLFNLPLPELMDFKFNGIPLGQLCLPGLRWILRRHHLNDDEPTRYLLREYIRSAWNIAQEFESLIKETQPRAVVVFNGQMYPEATAKFIARKHGIRALTHEVGLRPKTVFFTEGEATAYPLHIPDEFELNDAQNARLDDYLSKRFQGDFTMAGMKFWSDMRGLDEEFLAKAAEFKQIVPIFTNVIFDTSQPHANTVFGDMFTWLDEVLWIIRMHPETLFVIRAHPDETRLRKASLETVEGWYHYREAYWDENVIFVPPQETLSSYELIQRAKFTMIYNSTIGMEASIMGEPVLCAGKARFTQYPTVFFPQSVEAYKEKLEEFLNAESIEVPAEFKRNARQFLYYQLYFSSLPFGEYLETGIRTSHGLLKDFDLERLLPENSPTIKVILDGVLNNGDFLLKE
ncbi:MAG: hypothetical protein GY755_04095 [Chloroflexi bacterium]|nr:hypothetical protein [Chloroflexota bacterium]